MKTLWLANRLISPGRVLGALLVLSGMFLAIGGALSPPAENDWAVWLGTVAVNIACGVVGACVAFFLVDMHWKAHEAQREREERALEVERQTGRRRREKLAGLTAAIKAGSAEAATSAIEELRVLGWLEDGALEGADLRGAKLNSADLSGARLARVDLTGAVLDGADLTGADLRLTRRDGCSMLGCITEGTVFD